MIDSLSAFRARIDHHAIAFGQVLRASDFSRGPEQVAEQIGVVFYTFSERDEVFARSYENMDRGLRIDVGKGIAELVLVDGGGGDASFDDPAEETTHDGNSVQERVSGRAPTSNERMGQAGPPFSFDDATGRAARR